MRLAEWQAKFFAEYVVQPRSGDQGVYFREQVFGAVDVLSGALPDLEALLGTPNFRYFVREMLVQHQPCDALGTSLVGPFLDFLAGRGELQELPHVQEAIAAKSQRSY